MKVKLTKTGEVVEYDIGYAIRLIEQGKAVKAETADQTDGRVEKSAGKKQCP